MNIEDLADAKDATQIDSLGAGNSSTPGENDGLGRLAADFINTVDIDPAEPRDLSPAEDAESNADNEDGDKDGAAKSGQDTRYDKDPAWQRILGERDEALKQAAKAEGMLEAMQTIRTGIGPGSGGEGAADVAPYKDISGFTKDELLEWFEEDPVEFLNNFANQVVNENTAKERQMSLNQRISKTYSDYEAANEDFKRMWDSGEIEKFMDENPGHNAISAHLILTQEARLVAEIEKAVKEREAKVRADFQAKRSAHTLSDGGSGGNRGGGDEREVLKNTKQSGGLVATLADRLRARRQGVGG